MLIFRKVKLRPSYFNSIICFHILAGPDSIEHATGIEKWELMAAQAGNDVS